MANTVNAIGNNTVFLYFPTTDKFNAKKSSIPATSVTFIADTGQIYANGMMFGGNTTTPKAHDSSTTKYGGATASLYGHVKLFDAAGSQAAKDSAAATPYALNAVSTALGSRISTVESGISDLSTALGRTDGRINTDVINYLSAGTGVAVTNDSDSAGKKYGSISVKAKATDVSTSVGGTTPRVYAVGVDKNGDLAVKVDWSVYTHPSHTAINKSSTWLTGITVDTLGHVTGVTNSSLPAATTSAAGIVRLTDSSVSESTTTAPTASALKSVNDAAKAAAAAAAAAPQTYNIEWLMNLISTSPGNNTTLTAEQFNEIKTAADAHKIFVAYGQVLSSSTSYRGDDTYIELTQLFGDYVSTLIISSLNGTYNASVTSNQIITQDDLTGYATQDDLTGYAKASDIPTKTSQLTNDSGFLTEHQSLDGYVRKREVVKTYPNNIGYGTSYTLNIPSIELAADKFNIVGRCSGLTLTLPAGADMDGQEYCCQFYVPNQDYTLTVPADVRWQNGEVPTFEGNTCCQLVIINNCATIGVFKASS